MRRLLFAAPLALLLAGAACGGDDSGDADADATPTSTGPLAQLTQDSNQQPQAPDTPVAAPTAIPSDVAVVQVVNGEKAFAPLRAEFAALPKVTIEANGKTYEGVSLAALAEKAGAGGDAIATIQGTRADNLRLAAIRYSLGEIGGSTVFVMEAGGHLMLASTSVPPEQWLKDVTGISLK